MIVRQIFRKVKGMLNSYNYLTYPGSALGGPCRSALTTALRQTGIALRIATFGGTKGLGESFF
jgi:hypothetical protein